MHLLRFEKIEQQNKELIKKVREEYERLFAQDPVTYANKTDKEHYHTSQIEKAKILPDEEQISYIARDVVGKIIGYIRGERISAEENIPLPQVPGFKDYSRQGDTFSIDEIEVFKRGEGFGSAIIKQLKNEGYELIDLKTQGEQRVNFFKKNDFKDSTLKDGIHSILVWNNPQYHN